MYAILADRLFPGFKLMTSKSQGSNLDVMSRLTLSTQEIIINPKKKKLHPHMRSPNWPYMIKYHNATIVDKLTHITFMVWGT